MKFILKEMADNKNITLYFSNTTTKNNNFSLAKMEGYLSQLIRERNIYYTRYNTHDWDEIFRREREETTSEMNIYNEFVRLHPLAFPTFYNLVVNTLNNRCSNL